MNDNDWLTAQFETNRSHVKAVAYRMLGSLSEADDTVQEARLRLNRAAGASERASRSLDGSEWIIVRRAQVHHRAGEGRRDDNHITPLPD